MPSMRANISGMEDQVDLCCSESIQNCLQQLKLDDERCSSDLSVHDKRYVSTPDLQHHAYR